MADAQGHRSAAHRLGSLGPPERERLLTLCGLLGRPVLAQQHARRARALLQSPDWKPVPRLPALHLVEPLLRHHALRLGVDPERLFEAESGPLAEPLSFERLAQQYYRRREALLALLRAWCEAGLPPPLLIKGAALAPLYPSPALRPMSDFDLVVASGQVPAARTLLRKGGWAYTSLAWAGPCGGTLDLLEARSPLAREVYDASLPHPAFPPDAPARLPHAGQHLALLAQHAAKHSGTRLWRDLCDVHLITENESRPDVVEEALAFARRHGLEAPLQGLLLVARSWTEGAPSLGTASAEAEQFRRLYLELAADRISPAGFDLLASLFQSPGRFLAQVVKTLRDALRPTPGARAGESGGAHAELAAQTDPVLGAVPVHWPLRRQAMKLRLLTQAMMTQEFSHYRKLIRLRNTLPHGKRSFEPVGAEDASAPGDCPPPMAGRA